MVTVIARYLVSDGHAPTVQALLAQNAQATRAEPGCLAFSVYQHIDNPAAFLLYERYTTEEAFAQHRRTPHFINIIERQVVPFLKERVWTRVQPRRHDGDDRGHDARPS